MHSKVTKIIILLVVLAVIGWCIRRIVHPRPPLPPGSRDQIGALIR